MRDVKFLKATSIGEAITFLDEYRGQAQLIAGGTDVLVQLREEEKTISSPLCLVDVFDIMDMRAIQEEGDLIRIGSMVTHTEIAESAFLNQAVPFLSLACSQVGGPQIRNRGTVGGNIVNASPAADSVPVLIALDAMVHLRSNKGKREVPLSAFFVGPYKTSIDEGELLTEITFKRLPEGSKTNFVKVGRRRALSISRMNLAVSMHCDAQGHVDDMRFAAGSVMPRPRRIKEIESLFLGKTATPELLQKAKEEIGEVMVRESGIRKSTIYKKPVIGDITYSAIESLK